jgi:1-deoxy-D-xylulose 5-phosphate reductoisomerase
LAGGFAALLDLPRPVGSIFTLLHATAFPVWTWRIELCEPAARYRSSSTPQTKSPCSNFSTTKLGFTAIPRVIKETMDAHDVQDVTTLEMVRRVDKWARECARHTAQALELNA